MFAVLLFPILLVSLLLYFLNDLLVPPAQSPVDCPNIQIPASPSNPKSEHGEVPADSTNTQTVLSSLSAPMEHEEVPAAASSSSGLTLEHDVVSHDVFLSFRGEDTRDSFTDHLYHAMKHQGIDTFRDTEKLERGHSISSYLMKAIKESRIAVIILSANYATSTWCLEELAQIVECEKSTGLKILPVFYHVEPSEVRKQTGDFGKAFCKHEETSPGKVRKWREALTKVASISGWDVVKGRGESEVIQTITTEILKTLHSMCSSDNEDLIGMDARIETLMSYLNLGSNDVRTVGIAGMGGIGKSTLAKTVFEKIRIRFKSSCFIADVRGKSLVDLQELLCQHLQLVSHEGIQNDFMGINFVKKGLRHREVFIILDDVDLDDADRFNQLKDLVGKESCLGPGSRVIITTRDEQMLRAFGLQNEDIYEVQKLTDKEAFQLLCQKAFKENHAPDEYMGLSNTFVKYCSGLPLALVVLGSHLYKRTVEEWSAALARLDKDPHKDILRILRISFDGLEETDKEIFLDIACFFRGENQYRVKQIFKSCGFEPDIGIPVLIEKHLIGVEEDNLWMHDLLQQMGWHIVQKESPKPGKRSRLWLNENSHKYQHSRLWFDEDTRDVVTENLGTSAVRGISLSVPDKEEIQLKADPFLNMRKLRLLKICNVNLVDVRFEYLSNKLRLLEWHECPLESLPSSFQPDKLVELKLPKSRIETLWNQRLCLEMLRLMDLSYCQYLVKTPDFSNFPNLEELTFKGCSKLSDVHPTLWRLKNLKVAILEDCTSLERLPKPISLMSLAVLSLSGCSKLDEFPEIMGNGETLLALSLDGTAIRELPTTIRCLSGLTCLNLCECKNLVGLPSVICSLTSLRHLLLSSSSIDQLPEDIGSLENLEKLDACNTPIRKVPSSIVLLKNLKSLCFQGCRQVPGKCSDESLGLQLPKSFSGLSSLETLFLGKCDLAEGAIPDDIGCLSSLKLIRLDENNFVSIPESISQLPKLRNIHIPNCSKLQSLPNRLPEDVNVVATGCPLLTNYPNQLNVWLSYMGIPRINCANSNDASCPLPIPEELQIEKYLPKYIEDKIVLQLRLQLCFFHTKIPDWCRHKNSGSSVAMHVSYHEINRSLGVALFVVFEILKSDQNFDKSWESQETYCTFKDEQGQQTLIFFQFEGFRVGTHEFVCFQPLKFLQAAKMLRKAGRFEASVSTDRPDLEVKSCGLELIFQGEARNFAENLIEDCTPQAHIDFKFGRHCKELINAKGKESSGNIMAPNEAEKVSWKFDFNMHPGEDLQLLKVFEDFNRDFIYNATYPHCSKLLEWFGDRHLSRGPSVKIPLPPSLSSDGNWIGLALCARFSDLENQTTSIDKVNPEIAELVCHLETENSGFGHLHNYRPTNEELKRLCPTEFIWLSYIPRQGYLDQLNNQCDLLETSFASESRGLFAEECGLRLVYQHDEQEFKDLCICMNSLLDKKSERLEEHEAPKKGKQVREFHFNMHPREDLQSLLSLLYEGPYGREKDFGLLFPHKVVPFWFFHQYAGDVALCDFPLDSSDNQRWIGLELFVMVSSGCSMNVESSLDVDLSSDEISTISTSVKINTSLGSDQLVVIHIPRVRFPEQLNQCPGISALFRTATPDMRVQMCGSRLLYEQDLEDLVRAITVCTLGSQDVIDSLCQHIQQLLGSCMPVEPLDHIAAVETAEQNLVEREKEVGRKNDHCSTEREDLIQDRRQQVFTSILHNYRSYLQQKHDYIESERIISHSEGYIFDNGNPKPVFATHHLHVMVETRIYGSLSSEDWKRSLESLLQYFKVATLSVKGQMIAVLNPFTPSSVNNFCFPRKELPE